MKLSVQAHTVKHPGVGHEITFLQSAADTGGALLQIEYAVARPEQPLAYIPWHCHRHASERFEVVAGRLGMMVGRKTERRVLDRGEAILVEPGVGHAFWNEGPAQLRFLTEIRPAGQLQRYWEAAFGWAATGRAQHSRWPGITR